MRGLLDVSRLWQAFGLAAAGVLITFVVAVVSGANELSGAGNPLWMDVIALVAMAVSALLTLWWAALFVKWLVLKLGRR